MEKLKPTLQRYIDHLAANQPLGFTEIVSVTPGVNLFRHLKTRGLIRDISKKYEPGEDYTGPRESKYVLTEAGEALVTKPPA